MSKTAAIITGIISFALVAIGLMPLQASAATGTEPAIHFVIDVSGSMSGEKLQSAVEAIDSVAADTPDTTALGLRSYAGSCDQSAVDPLVPIGTDNDSEISAAAHELVAGGGTPTTAALGMGLDELAADPTTGPKRLVLLTDGDTQCGVTICDYVKQHAASSVQITMYTVGLQVSDSAASDLKCAAEQTGGKFLPAASPEDLTEALKEAAAAGLSIDAFVTDYEPWIDPTGTQPFVLLKFYVSGPGGLPAEGAKVRLSNSPKATFTVPASGWLRLVQDVSKGDEVVSITATKGDLTGSKEIRVFSEEMTVRCVTPGEPSRLNALSYYLDFVIPNAGNLPRTMENFYEWLGGVNKVTSNLPQDLETVAWGTEYTGTFKTIYGLDARVQEVKTGDSYKEFNAVFSRKSALLDPLFKGDGTPIQQLGRRFTCSGAVA